MTVEGRIYRGRICREWLDARWAGFFDATTLSPRLVRAYVAASAALPVSRRLWSGLLRPGMDRRLMRG
jgi:hypothetical protein